MPIKTQTIVGPVTNTTMDNMDNVTFTTMSRPTSPPMSGTKLEVVLAEFVTTLDAVDSIVDTLLEFVLGDGVSFQQLPQKGFQ